MSQGRIMFVYVLDPGVLGEVISFGAHMSIVKYSYGGIEYEVPLSNEEFIERSSIGYEEEND